MKGVVRGQGSGVRELLLGVVSVAVAAGAAAQTRTIDDFASVAGWKAAPSDGVTLAMASDAGPDGRAMRLDFDFQGHGGWAAVRKTVDLELPENYEFTFRIRGDAPSENLEFKLVDASGDNVWWSVRRDFAFPRDWQTVRIKKRQISFAWGPAGGGEPKRVAAIELAITAGSGGKGSVWISDLALTPLPPDHPYAGTPVATASSSLPGRSPAQALTGEGGGWHSDPSATGPQWLAIDFGERREIGGLVDRLGRPPRTRSRWRRRMTARRGRWPGEVTTTHGARSFVPLPEADARFVRLTLIRCLDRRRRDREARGRAARVRRHARTGFIASSVAEDSRRGLYPRALPRRDDIVDDRRGRSPRPARPACSARTARSSLRRARSRSSRSSGSTGSS